MFLPGKFTRGPLAGRQRGGTLYHDNAYPYGPRYPYGLDRPFRGGGVRRRNK